MIATSTFVTALDRTKFVFGWGSAPDPAGGAYGAYLDPVAGLRGPTSNGEGERKGRGGREDGRYRPPFCKFLDLPLECVKSQTSWNNDLA